MKSGAGTVILTAANHTFTGNIAVNAGLLQFGTGSPSIPAQLNSGSYAGNIFIAAGATFALQGTSTNTLSGDISGDGNLVLQRGATILSGDNSYTGKTTIGLVATNGTGNTVTVSSFNSVVGGTATSSLGAPTTVANGTIEFGGGVQSTAALVYNGSGETTDRVINFNFNNNSSSRNITANNASGLLKFTSAFTSNGATGNVSLGGSGNAELVNGLPFGGSSGVLTKSGGSTWTLGGPVGLTGGVTLNGATAGSRLNINHAQALGTGTFTISGGDNATIGNTSGADIIISTNNAQTWSNNFAVVATNSLNMGTGAVTLGGNRVVSVSGGGTFTVGGVISGAGINLTLGGSGTMALTGEASTYTGQTIIGNNTANTLKLQVTKLANSAAVSSIGAPAAGANSVIQIGANSNPSTLELVGGTSASSTNRQVQIGSSAGGSGGATILNNNTNAAHTLTFSNAAFNVAATGTSTFNRSLTLGGSNTGDNTISGNIIPNASTTGVTSLVKSGTGKWVLEGTNSYNGGTNINGGILQVSGTGSINTTTAINVAAGAKFVYNSSTALTVAPTLNGAGTGSRAILGGTGPIDASITLNDVGDVLSPGNSPGIMSFTENQTWASNSYDWELNNWVDDVAGTNIDLISITGSLTLSGTTGSPYILNVLSLTAGNVSGDITNFAETTREWTILTTTAGITGFDGALWAINTDGFSNTFTQSWTVNQVGNNLVLSYGAIPEPSTMLLGALGALALLRRRR